MAYSVTSLINIIRQQYSMHYCAQMLYFHPLKVEVQPRTASSDEEDVGKSCILPDSSTGYERSAVMGAGQRAGTAR